MKYSDNAQFHGYCKLFDIIAVYETWQKCKNEFDNFLQGYTHFESIRKRTRNSSRGSGGVSVFVKDWVIQTSGVKRIFDNFQECVVLLFEGNVFRRTKDIIMIFTYQVSQNT